MGPTGLTAVFGMGTGVAPPVWSPGKRPAGGEPRRPCGNSSVRSRRRLVGRRGCVGSGRDVAVCRVVACSAAISGRGRFLERIQRPSRRRVAGNNWSHPLGDRTWPPVRAGVGSGWSSDRLLGLVRCDGRPSCTPSPSTWSSSRSLRTKSAGNLVSEGASRLDAFSAYPVPTWLPGGAPSGTAGTPEVGPPQSSRTRGDAPQVSYAHGR